MGNDNVTIEIDNIPDDIMKQIDFEENEIYLKICTKFYDFED